MSRDEDQRRKGQARGQPRETQEKVRWAASGKSALTLSPPTPITDPSRQHISDPKPLSLVSCSPDCGYFVPTEREKALKCKNPENPKPLFLLSNSMPEPLRTIWSTGLILRRSAGWKLYYFTTKRNTRIWQNIRPSISKHFHFKATLLFFKTDILFLNGWTWPLQVCGFRLPLKKMSFLLLILLFLLITFSLYTLHNQ